MRVLFVCLGNICRSPAAETIFKYLIDEKGLSNKIEVDSAGTYGGHSGDRADSRMIKAAKRRGYNISSISRQVKSRDFDEFDLIVAMDDSNYDNLCHLAPSLEAKCKIHRFARFISKYDYDYVPDPYYEGADGFELVLDILEDGCTQLLDFANSMKK